MKKLLLAGAALWLALAPAKAGTITITVVTAVAPCNAGACTKTWTDTDANLAKIITAYAPGCQAQNLVGTPPVPTACTALQTILWWAQTLVNGTVTNVTNELTQAEVQAIAPVVPINPQ